VSECADDGQEKPQRPHCDEDADEGEDRVEREGLAGEVDDCPADGDGDGRESVGCGVEEHSAHVEVLSTRTGPEDEDPSDHHDGGQSADDQHG
jgi:hypothetical protein